MEEEEEKEEGEAVVVVGEGCWECTCKWMDPATPPGRG